jgi:hypothetical protein
MHLLESKAQEAMYMTSSSLSMYNHPMSEKHAVEQGAVLALLPLNPIIQGLVPSLVPRPLTSPDTHVSPKLHLFRNKKGSLSVSDDASLPLVLMKYFQL